MLDFDNPNCQNEAGTEMLVFSNSEPWLCYRPHNYSPDRMNRVISRTEAETWLSDRLTEDAETTRQARAMQQTMGMASN